VEPTAAAFSLDGVSESWSRSEAEVEAMRGMRDGELNTTY